MKVNIEYECEICHNKSYDKEYIEDCENKGAADISLIPIGFIYKWNWDDTKYGIFCVAQVIASRNHFITPSMFACRSWMLDNLDNLCGNGDLIRSNKESIDKYFSRHEMSDDDLKLPEFTRMMEHIKTTDIKPCYFSKEQQKIIKL
jgi:hypothetical protein